MVKLVTVFCKVHFLFIATLNGFAQGISMPCRSIDDTVTPELRLTMNNIIILSSGSLCQVKKRLNT